jgi:hypothetical protein
VGGLEGRIASHHDEQNGANSKEIDSRATISLLKEELRGHIVFGAQNGSQVAFAGGATNKSSETEICDLQIEFGVENQVLWLDVSVANTFVVAEFKGVNDAKEEGSSHGLAEFSVLDQILKELSVGEDLHDEGNAFICVTILLEIGGIGVIIDQIYDVGVLNVHKDLDLLLEGLQIEMLALVLDDLHGRISTGLRIVAKFNLRVEPRAKG